MPNIVKEVTIKDAVYWASHAWEGATAASLNKSWKHLLPAACTPAPENGMASTGTADNDMTVTDESAVDVSSTDLADSNMATTGVSNDDDSAHDEASSEVPASFCGIVENHDMEEEVVELFTQLGYEADSEQ